MQDPQFGYNLFFGGWFSFLNWIEKIMVLKSIEKKKGKHSVNIFQHYNLT